MGFSTHWGTILGQNSVPCSIVGAMKSAFFCGNDTMENVVKLAIMPLSTMRPLTLSLFAQPADDGARPSVR